MGVGLTVVERLVNLHGGRVEAFSEGVGRGSEFRVLLPCISEVRESSEGVPKASPLLEKAPSKRVLVVDDNADAAETIAVFLRLEGHDVRTASDGPQALACSQIFTPEVAVVDIGLPGMDGYEVARQLARCSGALPLLIALTGYGQSEDVLRSQAAGFLHHFIKPADPAAIHAAIIEYATRAGGSAQDRSEAN